MGMTNGQQFMHPTMGPMQMMPVTQMVQVMVPVLMPYPPPQPGQMMIHPGMMGQPFGLQQPPRPQPAQGGRWPRSFSSPVLFADFLSVCQTVHLSDVPFPECASLALAACSTSWIWN